jgi:hypothetical protein
MTLYNEKYKNRWFSSGRFGWWVQCYLPASSKIHDQHYVPQMILLTPGRLLSASKDGESREYLFDRSDYSYIVIVRLTFLE